MVQIVKNPDDRNEKIFFNKNYEFIRNQIKIVCAHNYARNL